jgi:hypothetical protein
MFERYTEKARRAIFFARYEASQFGSPYIDTEHLLLGLLRESKDLAYRCVRPPGSVDAIRKQIEDCTTIREKVSTSVDLPLSNESKRVLAYAAEEAESLSDRHIGTEHLLLGLLREENCFAAQILRQYGAQLEKLRMEFAKFPEPWPQRSYQIPAKGFSPLGITLELHGAAWNADYVHDAVLRYRAHSWHWQKRAWQPRDIVIARKDGARSFDLALAEDSANFELVKSGWKKDHCLICRWELFEAKDDPAHGIGYTNGRDWLCTECHEKFFERPDFFSSTYPEIT